MGVTLDNFGVTLGHCGVTLEPLWRQFGITLGLLCGHCGITLCTLGSLWDDFRHMSMTLESLCSVFEKLSFPPHIKIILCNYGISLGSFWDHFGLDLSI